MAARFIIQLTHSGSVGELEVDGKKVRRGCKVLNFGSRVDVFWVRESVKRALHAFRLLGRSL